MKKVINMDLASEARSGGEVDNLDYNIYVRLSDNYEFDFIRFSGVDSIIDALQSSGSYSRDKLKEYMLECDVSDKYLDEICSSLVSVIEEMHNQIVKDIGDAFNDKMQELSKSYDNQVINGCKITYDEANKALEFSADDYKIIDDVASQVAKNVKYGTSDFADDLVRQYKRSFQSQQVWNDGEFNQLILTRIEVITPFDLRTLGLTYFKELVISQDYEDPIEIEIIAESLDLNEKDTNQSKSNASNGVRLKTFDELTKQDEIFEQPYHDVIRKISHYLRRERPFGVNDVRQIRLATKFEDMSGYCSYGEINRFIDVNPILKQVDISQFNCIPLDDVEEMKSKSKSVKDEIRKEIETSFGEDFIEWISDNEYKFTVKKVDKDQMQRLATKISLICQGLADFTEDFFKKIYDKTYNESSEVKKGKLIQVNPADILDVDSFLKEACQGTFDTSKGDFNLLYQVFIEQLSNAKPISLYESDLVIIDDPQIRQLSEFDNPGVRYYCRDVYGRDIDLDK